MTNRNKGHSVDAGICMYWPGRRIQWCYMEHGHSAFSSSVVSLKASLYVRQAFVAKEKLLRSEFRGLLDYHSLGALGKGFTPEVSGRSGASSPKIIIVHMFERRNCLLSWLVSARLLTGLLPLLGPIYCDQIQHYCRTNLLSEYS